MRVTNRMLTDRILSNINQNLEALSRIQGRMSSGLAVTRPSDDPVAMAQILSLQTTLRESEQYVRNMDDSIGWVDVTEAALAGINKVLGRIRELAIYGASGSLDQGSLNAIAMEIEELSGELEQVANTTYQGRYVFGGTQTLITPFTRSGNQIVYNGNSTDIRNEVAPGVTMSISIPGSSVFVATPGQPSALFGVLSDMQTALETGDTKSLTGTILDRISQYIDHTQEQRAVVGAKSNRLEIAKTRSFESQIEMTKLLSRLKDVDLAEEAMKFKNQEVAYQAALSVGARVMQISLADFLK